MSTMHSMNFDVTSNIQHVDPYSSAMSSEYVASPQDMPMNERIGYDNANYLANYSKNSASYANAPIHNSAPYVTPNSSRINENSANSSRIPHPYNDNIRVQIVRNYISLLYRRIGGIKSSIH